MHVDGFGTLADLEIADLSPTLSVVAGPNETGKSTLLDFVKAILFGFPDRRSRFPQREPLRGGRHGGAIRVLDDSGCEWVVERHADPREPKLTSSDGRFGGEAELRSILGHADAGIFRSVFAFGLDELGSLAALEEDDVRDLIFSAGILGAGKSATAALRTLEERRSSLVRPRSSARVNDLQKRLESVEHELNERRVASLGFASREAELRRLEAATEDARQRRVECETRRVEIDRLITCWPVWNRIGETEARLARLPATTQVDKVVLEREPEIRRLVEERSGHVERTRNLAKLRAQRDGQEASRRELEATRASLAQSLSRDRSAPQRSKVELANAARAVQMLRTFISQRDQLEAKRDQRQALALTARGAQRSRSRSLVSVLAFAFVGAAVVASAGFARHQSGLGAGATAVAAALLVALALTRAGRSNPMSPPLEDATGVETGVDVMRLSNDISKLARALGLADQPLLAEVDAVGRAIDEERELRVGLDDVERKLADVAGELAKLDVARARLGSAIEDDERSIRSFDEETASLAAEASFDIDAPAVDLCTRLSASLDRAKADSAARRTLGEALESARSDLAAIVGVGLEADAIVNKLKSSDPTQLEAERESISGDIEDAERAWESARDVRLDASHALDELMSSTEIASLELEIETLRSEREAALKEWLVLGTASALLKTTIDRYEKERQPEVIARASELFSLVTGGRYDHLIAREDERSTRHGIVAVSSRGNHVDSSSLSRGTAEQLYLCLRLALAATHAEQTVSLPFVLDDVLVNFDPERAKAVTRAIVATAQSHQVLAFTCHPHVVELIESIAPDCTVVDLPAAGTATVER